VMPVKRPVSLTEMRETPELSNMALIRQSRRSVCPVSNEEWRTVCRMAGVEA